MEVVFHIILIIFGVLIFAFAVTLGVSLLLWIAVMGLVLSVVYTIRQRWQRWQFVKANDPDRPNTTTEIHVIEGTYTEVTDRKP
jgi:membrane protein implicated in regulation of membrane protease activity